MEPLKPLIDAILKRLQSKGANALELLSVYQTKEHEPLWRADGAELHQAFARKLISQGHPTRGLEVAREGAAWHPGVPALRYLLALARTRGGDLVGAAACLGELTRTPDLSPHLQAECLSLGGRIDKDRYVRSRDAAQKAGFAAQSAVSYRRAADLPDAGSFPVINAATMTVLAGDTAGGRELARTAIVRAQREREQPGGADDYWLMATLGEAHFILGDIPQAATWYNQAVARATEQGDVGSIGSMRHNALLLKEKLEMSEQLLQLFHVQVGGVVAFAGHMIDHPQRVARDRLAPRFPADPQLVREVGEAIRAAVADLNANIGFCSVACGSDVLFAEAMLARDAELHVVLPFARADFYKTSVDFGGEPAMRMWRTRVDAVLDRVPPEHIHYATAEPFLGAEILFDFVNRFTQGLAVTRAAQRGVVPHALVVLDPGAKVQTGGTGYFLRTWEEARRPTKVIDLRELRQRILGEDAPAGEPAARPAPPPAITRQIKAMLFADVKDFSKLQEEDSPRFFQRFLAEIHGVLTSLEHPPTFGNTWGDGLYLVFDEATHCAEAALRLLQRAEQVNWKAVGLGETSPIRIGLHAGPVYSGHDPIIGKMNYYGSHVNRAARIEPVTIPGCAFLSEQFAALLAIDPARDYVCEYIGIEPLAKGYDRCPLYRLARR